jgi:F-type H+-transporting ATPase subunit gamma
MHALRIISVGELAARECESQGIRSDTQFTLPGVVESIPQLVRLLLVDLDQWLQQYPAASVSVFHQRTTVKGIEPVHYQLVPVAQNRTTDSPRWPSHKLPGISLSGDKLLIELIREHLFVSLYRACAESQAAEYASRFSSMQSANRNIDDQVNSLEGQMHQQRQATITNELLDTVAGYNSIVQNK